MRITFDSNVWQMVVRPSLVPKHENYGDFCAVHEALRSKRIEGFICETVGTLEAIKRAGRSSYFNSIRPIVEVKLENVKGNQSLISVNIGTNHRQHPGLVPILQDGLEAAFALGIRVMRAARIGIPVPVPFLSLEHYADEHDRQASAKRDNYWGEVLEAIELRGVGGAVIRAVKQSLRQGVGVSSAEQENDFARAIAEWADGDSVAAHVAYNNDVFCTEDKGNSAGGKSILDQSNRLWLQETYGMKFATIHGLAQQIR
jgi:hypothetical protein